MAKVSAAAGHAALAICESILLALQERSLIDKAEVRGILADAASAHRNAVPVSDGSAATHEAAATLIEAINAGGNSVRHK